MKKIIILVLVVVLVIVGIFVGLKIFSKPELVACTQEAMLCPDGSYVGRVGPNCEFEKCPNENINESHKNIAYLIEGQEILLQNGIAETEIILGSASKTITKYFGNETRGDFNSDGLEDIAFVVTQNSGGTGTFYYVVVALQTENGYQGTNAILLGDRIAPQTTEFRDNEIIVNYADRKPEESFAENPTLGISKYLKVVDGELTEIKKN